MHTKVILLALSTILGFSTAQNYTAVTGRHNVTNSTASAYTTLTTASPSLNDTSVGNTTVKIALSTTWTYNGSASVAYSNVTLTAPSLTGTSSIGILTASGRPSPSTMSSFYVIPASSTLPQETSGTHDASAASSSGAAGKLSSSGTGILGVIGLMGYLVV